MTDNVQNNDITTKKPGGRSGAGFAKGQSGNPGGRPKKAVELSDRCKDMTPKVLDTLQLILDRGKAMERIKAGEIILAYGHGKPTQRQEISGNDGGAIIIGWADDK